MGSSPALEYYGEQREFAWRFAHLDIGFIESKDKEHLRGLLPELWDLQPLTESTKAVIKEQSVKAHNISGPVQIADASCNACGVVGGLGIGDLQFNCSAALKFELTV